MADQYDPGALNMDRLHAYAHKVARETKKPLDHSIYQERQRTVRVRRERKVGWFGKTETYYEDRAESTTAELIGEHWTLLHLIGNVEENNYPRKVQEYNEQRIWALLPNGDLWYVMHSFEFTKYENIQGIREYRATSEAMSVEMVLEMDRDHPRYEHHDRQTNEGWWGDLRPGRVRAHAAGVGASLALKKLLSP